MKVVGALLLGWGEGDEARLVMILGETHAHLENAFNRRRGETLSLSLSVLVSVREICGGCVARFGF